MSRCLTALCAVAMSFALVLPIVPNTSAEMSIGVGDWWSYVVEVDEDEMLFDGGLKMKVIDKQTSGGEEVFLVKMTGDGSASGSFEGMVVSGDFTITGLEKRFASNFSFLWRSYMMEVSVSAFGFELTMTTGEIAEADPCQDDYIGDGEITGGEEVRSNCTMYVEDWANMLGFNESSDDEYFVVTTMTVSNVKQTVVVPAGTFECWRITTEMRTYYGPYLSDTEASIFYYSEEVGNYIKMEGDEVYGGIFSSLELKDYSTGGGAGISGFFSDYWWVLLLVVAAIVVVVLLIAMGRRGGRTPVPMPPQPQPGYPAPVPGGPPQPPPGTGGPGQAP